MTALRPMTYEERVERLLDGLASRKNSIPWCRNEARALLALQAEAAHYTTARPGWDPAPAFEAHDHPGPAARGNIEPEESALKTAH